MTKADEKEILDAIEIIRKDKIHQQNQIAQLKSIIKLQNESISILKSSNGDLKDALKHHESRGEMPRVELNETEPQLLAEIESLVFANNSLRDQIDEVSDDKLRDAFTAGFNSFFNDNGLTMSQEFEKWVNS